VSIVTSSTFGRSGGEAREAPRQLAATIIVVRRKMAAKEDLIGLLRVAEKRNDTRLAAQYLRSSGPAEAGHYLQERV